MKEKDVCEVECISDDVESLQQEIQIRDHQAVATIFKALADETRVKIAYALLIKEELCVCDVANLVGSSTATASHHLRLLRNLGLAKYRKEGKLAYYSLDDDHVKQIITLAYAHQKELQTRE
ncbi:ArsR/SmtB family transcription factor [Bacillus kexueae]|uniref:ArsR/SmtB family transcription factor n=1 Tax=Aeribacillus kexueae TaxID=2078952 RepID=UPI001FAFC194|nr:metalloregulator ArsR/SmtB family transcription factor [Bacillus kexueae]